MANKEIQLILSARDDTQKAFDNFKKNANNLGFNFEAMAKKGAIAFGAITTAIGITVKKSIDFQETMSDISTLMSGDATNSMNELSKGVLELTKSMPKSADELGGALYDVLSAGIQGTTKQLEVLRESSRLAVAGLGDTKGSVDIMTSAINAFNLQGQDANKTADILFKTVKYGKTTVDEMSQAFGATAPAIASAGFSLEDFSASVAALTTVGMPASQAQNQLRQAVVSLSNPSKEMQKLFDIIGKDSLPEMIKSGMTMGDIFYSLNTAADGNNETLIKAFGSVEAYNAAIGIGKTVNEAYKTSLEDMKNGINAVDEAFQKQSENTSNQLKLFSNNLETLGIKIGDTFLPILNEILKSIIPVIDKFTSWAQENPKLLSTIVVIVGALAGFITIIGIIGLTIPSIIAGFSMLGTAISVLGGAFMFLITNPIGLLILAIAGIITAVILLIKNWDKVKEVSKATWTAIGNIISTIGEGIKNTFKGIINFIIEKLNWLIDKANSITSALSVVPGVSIPQISRIPMLANGGIVRKPTIAMIGEAGAEAVIPLNKSNQFGNVNITITGNTILGQQDITDMVNQGINQALRLNTAI